MGHYSTLQPFNPGRLLFFFLTATVAIAILSGCSRSQPVAEAPPPVEAPPTSETQQTAKLPPPQMNEVQDAVNRVFKQAVVIDTNRKPSFIVGDFNGDQSQDITVVLKPVPEKLSALNEEFPTWILRDVSGSNPTTSPRLRVAATDDLLAVIHGYGPTGWRSPEATQTYLLKNAAGAGLTTHSAKEFEAVNRGKKVPQLRGDVVAEELGGISGYLYYAGATYSWYDPKTFKDEREIGMIHNRRREPMKKQ